MSAWVGRLQTIRSLPCFEILATNILKGREKRGKIVAGPSRGSVLWLDVL